MAQTKPKAAQFYGVSGDGTAGQVLISDGDGGMFWGANTENYTVSWNTPTGQSLAYTQPTPQSSSGSPSFPFPTTTFTATKSGEEISGTATIAGLPTGITATQSLSGASVDNVLTVTLAGVFPGADSLNTALTLSGLTVTPPLTVNYLVVAGGGGGGNCAGSGNGAGGGGAGSTHTVTVGGGGALSANGGSSVFSNITSSGGGAGAGATQNGYAGGSGGGGSCSSGGHSGGAGTTSQGFAGAGQPASNSYACGGGGGAGQIGQQGYPNTTRINRGGNGLYNSINGSNIAYAGGGGGGSGWFTYSDYVAPAIGGGGVGAWGDPLSDSTPDNDRATAGGTNLGGGGGGSTAREYRRFGGKAGGSGIVVLRYSDYYDITVGSGLTTSALNTAVGTNEKYTTFTAGTGSITFGVA